MSINNPYNLRQFRNKVQVSEQLNDYWNILARASASAFNIVQVSEQLNDYCPLETTAKSGKIRVSRQMYHTAHDFS